MKTKAALLIFFFLVIAQENAQALSCVQSPPPMVEFNQAQAVFSGKAVYVKHADGYGSKNMNYAKFDVYNVWKGEIPQGITVQTDGTWGIRFQEEIEYLVYLDKLDPYEISLCRMGTTELINATARIKQIEESGAVPTSPQSATLPSENARKYIEYGSVAAILAIAVVALKIFRQ
jgi:hypothetical protein